jgi:hypothetical protein
MNISYIISSLNNDSETLHIHFKHLFQIFEKKRMLNTQNYIKKIIIVKRKGDHYDVTNISGVPVIYLDYSVQVNNHEINQYSKWLFACEKLSLGQSDITYHILTDEKYCIDSNNTNFDIEMYDLYIEKFLDNVGYLCSCKSSLPFLHAVVSNGMISTDTINRMRNPLEKFNGENIDDFQKRELFVGMHPNLRFSKIITNDNILIEDVRGTHDIFIWNSYTSKTIDFSVRGPKNLENKEKFFIPIQKSPYYSVN